MKKTRMAVRVTAALAALSFIASACGGGSSDDSTAEPAADAPTYPTTEQCADVNIDYAYEAPASNGMTITYNINPDAVWDDGSPITAADFKATWEAVLNTPGSLSTTGFDQITSVEAGASDKEVVVELKTVYAPWKSLFGGLIKAASVKNTMDVSGDFADSLPFSARPWKMKSWSPSQVVFVPNDKYWGDDKPLAKELVMVPLETAETQAAALKAGEVDFTFPQFYGGIDEAFKDANVTSKLAFGGQFESFYYQMKCGPFANPIFREAFVKSIDRDALFQQIYVPLGGDKPLSCGPIVAGPYCVEDTFPNQFDPEGAAALLEENGWTKDAEGYWADPATGVAPDVRWTVNTGNTRRESTQAYLIPLLNAAGFKVRADNCDAACYFQQRLPAQDFDMAMWVAVAPPDPGYLSAGWTCNTVPTTANGNKGSNYSGWCNEEASDLFNASDYEADATKRADLVKQAIGLLPGDYGMTPLYTFPVSAFWRMDKLGGPVDGELANYLAFSNSHLWEDKDGDGKIVIGAEQWPACLNPVTECASSSWAAWTSFGVVQPGAFATTNDQRFVVSNLLVGEPTVTVK